MAAGAETHQDFLRLDKWLVYARFCKTRSQALNFVASGIRINGRKIDKPDAKLYVGDVLTLAIDGQIQLVGVIMLTNRRGPPQMAQACYEFLPQEKLFLE